jgi:Domain of unknown function (DUF4340)
MRGLKSTLALALVLAGLGAYIYYTADQPADTTSSQEKVFSGVTSTDIDAVTIKSAAGEVTSLKKDAGAWQLVSPVAAKAAESELSSITSAIEQLEITRVIDENPASLAEYGLETPRLQVDFTSANGKPSGTLMLGEKSPTGASLYARRNDEKKVFLVPAYQEQTLNKSTFDLRDKTLIAFEREKIDGLEIVGGGRSLQFKKAPGEWTLTRPVTARADFGSVEAVVGRLETAQMKSIAAAEPTAAELRKFGLDKPQATVTVHQGSARATLEIGGAAGEDAVYARDLSRPAIMTVETAIADELKKGVDDYRRKDVFEFRAFNTQHIELTRGSQTLTLDRVKGEGENPQDSWKRASPTAADADKTKVEELLAGLADIRAVSFTDSTAGTGLDKPVLTVFAKFEDGAAKEERVTFGQRGSDVFASRPGDAGAARIEADKLTEALKAIDELVK